MPFRYNHHKIVSLIGKTSYNTQQDCKTLYGFAANPNLPLWQNIESVITNMSAAEYFNRPVNMTYHNICNKKKPPDGIRVTLGLGLKFCIHQDKPKNAFQRSFSPFTDDVRKRYLFAGSALDCNTPKNFFVKPDFIPEPAT